MFGVGRGKVSPERGEAADKIARKHGADYAGNPKIPGEGYKYWFECASRGHPFDERTARAVMTDLEAAGLYPLAEGESE